MGFTDTAKQTALDAEAAAATWITLHTADPGTTGASEVAGGSYTREQTPGPPTLVALGSVPR